METKMGFLGWMRCETCAIQYITDPSQVTLWHTHDEPEIYAEIACPKCSAIVRSLISDDTLAVFERNGIEVRSYNDKFEPLTDDIIDSWDIDAELASFR
jgi:hypothetical protein